VSTARADDTDRNAEPQTESVTITFTLPELWLLHDAVRHDMASLEQWKFPPISLELNKEIGRAIAACTRYKLEEYTLDLKERDLLVIDYNVRRDFKTPEGARGFEILLKVFNARERLSWTGWDGREQDETYRQAITRTERSMSDATGNSTD